MKPSLISSILQTLEADQLNQMDEEMKNLVRAVEKTGKRGSIGFRCIPVADGTR